MPAFRKCFPWLLFLSLVTPALAQRDESAGLPLPAGTNQFAAWAGYSPTSVDIGIGVSRDRSLFLSGLQYSRILLANRKVALKYQAEITPFAFSHKPAETLFYKGQVIVDAERTSYAGGFSPLGLQFNLGARKVQPFVSGTIGALYFNEETPQVHSAQFNFTFNFGGGVEIFHREGRSVLLGVKYHHLSNAYTGYFNPGQDNFVFFAGYSFFRRK